MAKARIVESLLAGLTDSSGNPLAAGKVYSYEPGTTTPKSLYTDKDASSAASNPIVLNANGTSTAYAYGTYKFVIKTAADVTVSTIDNLNFETGDSSYWLPSISVTAPFTYTSVSIPYSQYFQIGGLVIWMVSFTGTAGGTLSSLIDFTLPVTSNGSSIASSVYIIDNSIVVAGTVSSISATAVRVRKYDSSAFTAGTVSVVAYGFYKGA